MSKRIDPTLFRTIDIELDRIHQKIYIADDDKVIQKGTCVIFEDDKTYKVWKVTKAHNVLVTADCLVSNPEHRYVIKKSIRVPNAKINTV
jgi:hypothetical protein